MNKDRRWLYIAILSLVIAIIWVGVSLALKRRQSTIAPDVQKVIVPLDPTIDQSIFTKLAKRKTE